MTKEELKQRNADNFRYHPTSKGQINRHLEIRKFAESLANILVEYCPPSRELSLALTNLEQAVMWADTAIARNESE